MPVLSNTPSNPHSNPLSNPIIVTPNHPQHCITQCVPVLSVTLRLVHLRAQVITTSSSQSQCVSICAPLLISAPLIETVTTDNKWDRTRSIDLFSAPLLISAPLIKTITIYNKCDKSRYLKLSMTTLRLITCLAFTCKRDKTSQSRTQSRTKSHRPRTKSHKSRTKSHKSSQTQTEDSTLPNKVLDKPVPVTIGLFDWSTSSSCTPVQLNRQVLLIRKQVLRKPVPVSTTNKTILRNQYLVKFSLKFFNKKSLSVALDETKLWSEPCDFQDNLLN